MKFVLIFTFLFLGSCGDNKTDHDVARSSEHSVYCIQEFLADADAWRIDFKNHQITTFGDINALPSKGNDESVELKTQSTLNAGLPYGIYSGKRASDGQSISITISSKRERPLFDSKAYKGTVSTEERTSELFCYDSRSTP